MSLSIEPLIEQKPWDDLDVIWRDTDFELRTEHMQCVASDASSLYIAREVQVIAPFLPDKVTPSTLSEAEDVVAVTEYEFDILEIKFGLTIARPEWHIATDSNKAIRLLARVPLVRPYSKDNIIPEAMELATESLYQDYIEYHSGDEWFLNDISTMMRPSQYVYGTFKDASMSAAGQTTPQVILVDIDPIFSNNDISILE